MNIKKKSRKLRAAKILDTSNDDSEQSDNSLILKLPKVPEKHNYAKTNIKNAIISQTGKSIIK